MKLNFLIKKSNQFLCQIHYLLFMLFWILIFISCKEKAIEFTVKDSPPEKESDSSKNTKLEVNEISIPFSESNEKDKSIVKGEVINKKREGKWVSYFPDGKIQSECFYVNGLSHGSVKVFLENGKLLYSGEYNMGKKSGKWKFIDPESSKITYKNY